MAPVHICACVPGGCSQTIAMQAVEHIRYYAGWADKIHGKIAPCAGNFQATVYKEPLGALSIYMSDSVAQDPSEMVYCSLRPKLHILAQLPWCCSGVYQ